MSSVITCGKTFGNTLAVWNQTRENQRLKSDLKKKKKATVNKTLQAWSELVFLFFFSRLNCFKKSPESSTCSCWSEPFRIKDFLREDTIKKIFHSSSSGLLVGRNSTLLSQIDRCYPKPLWTTLCWWWSGEEMRTCCSPTEKRVFGNQRTQSVVWAHGGEGVVRALAGLSRCHQRCECGGGNWDSNGMGVAQSHLPTSRRWRGERGGRDEEAASRKREESDADGGGSGPPVAPPSTFWAPDEERIALHDVYHTDWSPLMFSLLFVNPYYMNPEVMQPKKKKWGSVPIILKNKVKRWQSERRRHTTHYTDETLNSCR